MKASERLKKQVARVRAQAAGDALLAPAIQRQQKARKKLEEAKAARSRGGKAAAALVAAAIALGISK
jgi:hypothetical protein